MLGVEGAGCALPGAPEVEGCGVPGDSGKSGAGARNEGHAVSNMTIAATNSVVRIKIASPERHRWPAASFHTSP